MDELIIPFGPLFVGPKAGSFHFVSKIKKTFHTVRCLHLKLTKKQVDD